MFKDTVAAELSQEYQVPQGMIHLDSPWSDPYLCLDLQRLGGAATPRRTNDFQTLIALIERQLAATGVEVTGVEDRAR